MNDFTLNRTLHVGDFLRALVDEDDHEVALGIVLGDGIGDRLQDHCLAGRRRRDDQAALALPDGADQVDDPRGHDRRVGLQAQPLLRVERHQLGEVGPVLRLLGVKAVDLVKPDQSVELLPPLTLTWLADRALDDVALAQAVPAYLGQRDVDVIGAWQVAGRPHEAVVVENVENPGDRDEHVILGDHRLGVTAALAAPVRALVAVADPVAVPAAPALAVALVITPATVAAAVVAVALLVPAALLARVALLVATAAIADLVGAPISGGPALVIPAAVAAAPATVAPL